jgi:hypothetical protein
VGSAAMRTAPFRGADEFLAVGTKQGLSFLCGHIDDGLTYISIFYKTILIPRLMYPESRARRHLRKDVLKTVVIRPFCSQGFYWILLVSKLRQAGADMPVKNNCCFDHQQLS